jgi:hypothetical protein
MRPVVWLKQLLFPVILFQFIFAAPLFLSGQGPPTRGETIVMIRHGEKPSAGHGQLNCKGLNRALALAPLLIGRYGMPDALYVPNPAIQIRENNVGPMYSYVRPLATLEPTAIRAGLPVNTQIAYDHIGELQQALLEPGFAHSVIFVAWEHDLMYRFAQQMLRDYGEGASLLPPWRGWDFGTIYVLHVTRPENDAKPHVTLTIQQENLDGKLSNACPD